MQQIKPFDILWRMCAATGIGIVRSLARCYSHEELAWVAWECLKTLGVLAYIFLTFSPRINPGDSFSAIIQPPSYIEHEVCTLALWGMP